jgi:6-phosphofructokinase 1
MSKSAIQRLGVLCSGGDSPGMNAALRAVVRTGLKNGIEVYGIERGYAGILDGSLKLMDASSVGNIIQKGGTILRTSRCPEFHQAETRKEAVNILRRKKIDGLVVIGGDGSFKGANALYEEHHFPVIGIPGTIDNDISGTDYTIGFDTAVQTAVEAVDKIRDTAHAHARTFIVEVMGRRSPAIAMHVGVCSGAENIVLPTDLVDYDRIVSDIQRGILRGKDSSVIIVAEGEKAGLSYDIQKTLKEHHRLDAHVCILGHIQRGGSPSAMDRFIASTMGHLAVKALMEGHFPIVTAYLKGRVVTVPLSQCLDKKTEYLPEAIELVHTLSI